MLIQPVSTRLYSPVSGSYTIAEHDYRHHRQGAATTFSAATKINSTQRGSAFRNAITSTVPTPQDKEPANALSQ